MKEKKENIETITRKDGRPYTIRHNRARFFYPHEWTAFYDKLRPKQQFTYNLLLNTGARINEARHIKVEDIDFVNKRVILRVTKIKAKKGEKHPRPRTIPFSTQFGKQLKKYIRDANLKNPDYLGIPSTPAVNMTLKNVLYKTGIRDYYMFSAHNIRKTLETWLMSLGVDGLKLVAHIGHDMKTAATHYVSPDIFGLQEKQQMRIILGDLYQTRL